MARVKICGLSTPDTLAAALDAGADMVGFVVFPRSPRHVPMERLRALGARVEGRATTVALTVDADHATLDAIVAALAPDMLQLHGAETPARIDAVRTRTGRPVIKAIGIADSADLSRARELADAADVVLLDAKPPRGASRPGGNGHAFDWDLLRDHGLGDRWMLSGGLTVDTVAQALSITHAPAVDVSSGVESAPGVKDATLIRAFVAAARGVSAQVRSE